MLEYCAPVLKIDADDQAVTIEEMKHVLNEGHHESRSNRNIIEISDQTVLKMKKTDIAKNWGKIIVFGDALISPQQSWLGSIALVCGPRRLQVVKIAQHSMLRHQYGRYQAGAKSRASACTRESLTPKTPGPFLTNAPFSHFGTDPSIFARTPCTNGISTLENAAL